MRLSNYKRILLLTVALSTLYYFLGIGDYINAKDFDKTFDYPLNIDIEPIVRDVLKGNKPAVKPINYYPYKFLTNSAICNTVEKLDLFIVVKSAMKNFAHRNAIRNTYGRAVVPGRAVRTLFFLGVGTSSDTQRLVQEEMVENKDIIQMDFKDAYFNNTVKTMMSFRWLYEHCSTSDYYLFTDDDMYISVTNLLDYVESLNSSHIYSGYMFDSSPHRVHSSKWRISLEEYPWNKWPPYITAGAYVLSRKTMKNMYVASLFVKHFKFDDIFLGIVAKKVGIVPTHSDRFLFYKKTYDVNGYRNVIAAHGFDDHRLLVRAWNEQNNLV